MVNMFSKVKELFPELYTKRGELIKREPKKYKCKNCGDEFSKTEKVTLSGITFGFKTCDKCGHKGEDSISYNVWVRMKKDQVQQEDYILNEIAARGTILKDELQDLLNSKFNNKTDALGTLVYFGYLIVDKEKRDKHGIIEYSLGNKENFENRFELIR